jgi:hypothetical protein
MIRSDLGRPSLEAPRRAMHCVFLGKNDHRIFAQVMLLPLNFQFHLGRGLSADLL